MKFNLGKFIVAVLLLIVAGFFLITSDQPGMEGLFAYGAIFSAASIYFLGRSLGRW